jgi:beta-N-acetylhexosaminidase
LQMKAITEHYGFETAIRKALEAGIDILLIANNSDHYDETITRRAFTVIQQLVKDGIISEARIDQSYQRIRKLKSFL